MIRMFLGGKRLPVGDFFRYVILLTLDDRLLGIIPRCLGGGRSRFRAVAGKNNPFLRTTTDLNLSLYSPLFWQLRPQTSSTVVWVCRHIQSHVSRSLYLVTLDEVVGRTPYRGCTHRPRKASTKHGNYPRTTFQLGPPPPRAHPSRDVQLSTADN